VSNSKKILRVTVEDLETGDKESKEMPAGEYFILTTEPCHISHTQVFGGGKTVQLTIKDRVPR
jgi:hypothetical protein